VKRLVRNEPTEQILWALSNGAEVVRAELLREQGFSLRLLFNDTVSHVRRCDNRELALQYARLYRRQYEADGYAAIVM
jgi:hypothetical protein